MTTVRKAVKTCGISPKVLYPFITGVLTYALTKLAIPLDPIIEQGINIAAMLITGILAPSGDVVVEEYPGNDLIDPNAGDVRAPGA